ncbi:type II toxin-antitoxin system VapC family toxin [Pistricoccus aurantiacus]|uniref:Ribonuclease VapC n=1 Tax=Pistricoccus aurantiacus TaxID=1883414 RepID=A0A5B8SME7_9GAMM|nr:type II toxin-antitoxin system VapC family toxin [Pistricoccus aurantiacus]QEA38259.1 type II toxin-antitoxin system VapC family toxin [Pistricoccus aurantiacus]
MHYLVDTCVISEIVKPSPAPQVVEWLVNVEEDRLFLSVLTIGELQKGISALAAGRKRQRLQTWLDQELTRRFERRLLPIDQETAQEWGVISAQARLKGLAAPVIDTLLAATARRHNLVLITRNLRDFTPFDVRLFNPWQLD